MKQIQDYKQDLDIQNYSDKAFKEAILEIAHSCAVNLEQIRNTSQNSDGRLYNIYNTELQSDLVKRDTLVSIRQNHSDLMIHIHGLVQLLSKPKEEVRLWPLIKKLLTTKI